MKLDTAEAILEWARSHPTDATVTQENWDAYCETAERLALAVRVLALVEERANGAGYCTNGVCNYCPSVLDYCKHLLAEASAEKGDGK